MTDFSREDTKVRRKITCGRAIHESSRIDTNKGKKILTSRELERSLWLEIKRLIKVDNKKGV